MNKTLANYYELIDDDDAKPTCEPNEARVVSFFDLQFVSFEWFLLWFMASDTS